MADLDITDEEAAGMAPPPGMDMNAVMAALAAQQVNLQGGEGALHGPLGDFLTEEKTNSHSVVCPRCASVVLLAGVGKLHEAAISLLKLGGKGPEDVETLSEHWLVDDHMKFENVAVTRSPDGKYKMVACGACDHGPLGIVFLDQPRNFFVSHGRVKYGQN